MALIRTLLARRHLAMLICVAALAIKLLVPGGYMVSSDQGRISISICSGVTTGTMTMTMPGMTMPAMSMAGMAGHDQQQEQHGQIEMPCAFAGLSHHQALGAIDPVLLVAAIAFVMASGIAPAPRRMPALVDHLRPPSRGPPLPF